ncbi:MAP2B, partial [Symbiodinium sp. CCMP2592]
PRKMSMRGMNCRFVRNQAFAKRGMKCTPEEKEERLNAQKEAQKRFDEQKKKEAA